MEENSDAGAGTPEQPNVRDLLVNNARELFVLCDKEDKGFITKRDMQRLRNELPLDPDQLELVFDSLDLDHNGYLTLEEFTDGFGMFLGFDTAPRRMSCASATGSSETSEPATAVNTTGDADSDDDRFEEFLDNLGAQNIFKDEEYVQETWARLQMEQDPTMIRHFENFLAKVMGSIQNSEGHCFNLESALLNRKHKQDEQVELLYEEMEQQHKLDKEKLLAEERQKERKLRETLETELRQKDQLLHDLMTKHAQLESQLRNLHSNEVETKQENAKLIKELGKLERRLVDSEKTVEDMNRQVDTLRQQSIKEKRTRAKYT